MAWYLAGSLLLFICITDETGRQRTAEVKPEEKRTRVHADFIMSNKCVLAIYLANLRDQSPDAREAL